MAINYFISIFGNNKTLNTSPGGLNAKSPTQIDAQHIIARLLWEKNPKIWRANIWCFDFTNFTAYNSEINCFLWFCFLFHIIVIRMDSFFAVCRMLDIPTFKRTPPSSIGKVLNYTRLVCSVICCSLSLAVSSTYATHLVHTDDMSASHPNPMATRSTTFEID